MKLYLACPYTHPDPAVREYRFRMATLKAAELISEGNIVFSPLTMTVPMEKMAGLPQTFSYWKRLNFAFIDWCEEMRILNIEGVENSEGVQGEIQYAESIGRPHCMTPPPIEGINADHIGILTEKAEIYGEPNPITQREPMGDDLYDKLAGVLADALLQASNGKGKERHARYGERFEDQRMMRIARSIGPEFLAGQATKKIEESMGMDDPRRSVHDLLGAINYVAGLVLFMRERA